MVRVLPSPINLLQLFCAFLRPCGLRVLCAESLRLVEFAAPSFCLPLP